MKLVPFIEAGGTPFTASEADIVERKGLPHSRSRNGIGLNELHYPDVIYRFQDNGRLEEITVNAPVVYFGTTDVPFAALAAYVRAADEAVFERVGFIVSPKLGLAFDPEFPSWVTALAAHCIAEWRAL